MGREEERRAQARKIRDETGKEDHINEEKNMIIENEKPIRQDKESHAQIMNERNVDGKRKKGRGREDERREEKHR